MSASPSVLREPTGRPDMTQEPIFGEAQSTASRGCQLCLSLFWVRACPASPQKCPGGGEPGTHE